LYKTFKNGEDIFIGNSLESILPALSRKFLHGFLECLMPKAALIARKSNDGEYYL
jgi:hypothetical protein